MTSPAPAPTLREMVFSIVKQLFPGLPYKGLHTYTVRSVNADGSVELSPPQGATLLPPLSAVSQWCGAGIEAVPAAGSAVVVAFLDDDPRTPALVSFAPLRVSTPSQVNVFATGDVRLGGSAATAVAIASQTNSNIEKLRAFLVTVAGAAGVVAPPILVVSLPSTAAAQVKAV